MFSNKELVRLIIPLIIEQVLAISIGMSDTVMVAVVGEAAVSGIALVDTINVLLIQIFSALATGGAVVASQYIGKQDLDSACAAAKQLVYSIFAISLVIMGICAFCGSSILRAIYGSTAADVMENARMYFVISAFSYPFLALYNAGTAVFRAMGNSKISMFTALIMNIVNIGGNAILIFGFGLGVRGAAIASLSARILSAVVVLVLLHRHELPVNIIGIFKIRLQGRMVKNIMRIGIPNGLENGMFQIGKILVQGIITTFGTVGIAANAVANNIASIESIPGTAIGLAMITIIGQCIGAADYDSAVRYTRKLLKIMYISLFIVNAVILLLLRPLVDFYGMSAETSSLAMTLSIIHGVCCLVVWPSSFGLPNALRAANDAKFTMIVSIVSMWACRIALSYLFAYTLEWGVAGVWWAMIVDWTVRAIVFEIHFRRGRWKTKCALQ